MTAATLWTSLIPITGEGKRDVKLPKLLETPHGLALLELQGTFNLPDFTSTVDAADTDMTRDRRNPTGQTEIGRLVFPDYISKNEDDSSLEWTKRVYLYVGKHQRLTGSVKKLPKAIAVVGRRRGGEDYDLREDTSNNGTQGEHEELEIVEIVKWKILFSTRPEPVDTSELVEHSCCIKKVAWL